MSSSKRDAIRAHQHAKAVRMLERAETRLHRAFTAWSNARATVRRYEAELARDFAARAASTGAPAADVFNDKLPPVGGSGE